MYIISLAYGKFTQLIDTVIYLCILLKIVFLLLVSKNTHSGGRNICSPTVFFLPFSYPFKNKIKNMWGKGRTITELGWAVLYCIIHLLNLHTVCVHSFPFLSKKHKNILWNGKKGGGMLPPSCTYTEQPVEFSFLHTCDLASIRIFLSLSCLPTSFLHSSGQQLSLLHPLLKTYFKETIVIRLFYR